MTRNTVTGSRDRWRERFDRNSPDEQAAEAERIGTVAAQLAQSGESTRPRLPAILDMLPEHLVNGAKTELEGVRELLIFTLPGDPLDTCPDPDLGGDFAHFEALRERANLWAPAYAAMERGQILVAPFVAERTRALLDEEGLWNEGFDRRPQLRALLRRLSRAGIVVAAEGVAA